MSRLSLWVIKDLTERREKLTAPSPVAVCWIWFNLSLQAAVLMHGTCPPNNFTHPEGERDRETERQRQRETETDRQTDRDSDRDRQTDRQRQ